MLGVVQFGAFYVFYRRYQNCDALTGWLFYFVISVAILWVIVSFGLEPAPRPGDDATTTSADPGALP